MEPLVSIGMPVFNCEKTLRIAVRSILNQTYSNWELILIDDGSSDKTLEIANSFQDPRIKVVNDGLNQRLQIRLNQAIVLSNGKYFARMDGDDVSYPERLQRQVEYLEKHPEIDLLGTAGMNFDDSGLAIGVMVPKETHAEICAHPWTQFPIAHPTWMGKLEWFQKFQYRRDAIRMEDYDLLLRSYQTSQFASLPEILFGYRVTFFSLEKVLSSRYHIGITLIQKAITDRNGIFLYGVLVQISKSLIEIFLVKTGLGLKFLPHRVGKLIESTELIQWQEVWSQCNPEELAN
jgi:glycosyltransferase involved in cell wall biosynthesis